MEELPQKCVLESYLNRDEVAPFLDLAPPSLLLMDVCSVADPGSRSLRSLRIRHPSLPIVMISAQSVPEQIVRALRIGASGYLVTPLTSQHLVHCLRAANRGWPSLCQQAQESLVDWLLTSNQTCWNKFLSPREKQMLPFLLGTLSDRQIACALKLSIDAVDQILSQLLKKLMAVNRREALSNLMGFVRLHARGSHFTPSAELAN